MDKYGLMIVLLFLFMIVFGRSDAFNSRKLVTASDPNGSSNTNQDSPLSSPPPEEKKQNPSPAEVKDTPVTNPSDVESKGLTDANNTKSSENSSDKKLDKGKSHDVNEKVENQIKTFSGKICKGNPICIDQKKTIIACIQDFQNGSNKLTLGVQNELDIDLNVNIAFGTSTKNYSLPGHGTEKVDITFSGEKNTKVILNAGNGDCELEIAQAKTLTVDDSSKSKDADNSSLPKHADSPSKPKDVNNPPKPKEAQETNSPVKPKNVDSPSKSEDLSKSKDAFPKQTTTYVSPNNFFDQLSFYSKQVTPMYGAYFGLLVTLVIGGSWALCSFRKRRSDGGVAYQELEMGIPESSQAVDLEATEGWDQDWDDDEWDEDMAIRSKNVSSNGLTSRAVKKEGWDD